jgi:lipopolysaccharide/colanic/teichoic acid biosynthesis glycosyltransferase
MSFSSDPQNTSVGSGVTLVDRADLYFRVGKRVIDFLLSLFGLILLAPVLITVSAVIALSSPGPVLFRQQRAGKNGKPFWILKFRSMIDGAERMGGGVTPSNDPRVTPVGMFLRKWKFDELPQLWNVLKGDMSFVGPRPEVPAYVAGYSAEQRTVLNVRPGITDPASLRYRNEGRVLGTSSDPDRLYREEILPDKLRLNLQYVRNISLACDVLLILSTVKAVVMYSPTEERN